MSVTQFPIRRRHGPPTVRYAASHYIRIDAIHDTNRVTAWLTGELSAFLYRDGAAVCDLAHGEPNVTYIAVRVLPGEDPGEHAVWAVQVDDWDPDTDPPKWATHVRADVTVDRPVGPGAGHPADGHPG